MKDASSPNRMRRKRCLAALGVIVLLIVAGVCILPVRQGVGLKKVVLSVSECLATNGYTLSMEAHNDVPYTQPPLPVRFWNAVTKGDTPSRVGGVGHDGVRGDVFRYLSSEGREIRVAIDVSGEKVFATTVIGDTTSSNIFLHLEACLQQFEIGVQFKPLNASASNIGDPK